MYLIFEHYTSITTRGLHRAQLQLARLQWLHEDVFVQSGRHLSQIGMQNRSTIMSEMRKVSLTE
jgi:uncharacterized protein YciI